MAQVLARFEETIEPVLPKEANGAAQDFKGLVRQRFKAFADDTTDLFALGDGAVNDVAQEIRDKLSPTGRP
jgi:hypothetical protein